MKKLIPVLLVIILLIQTLTACSPTPTNEIAVPTTEAITPTSPALPVGIEAYAESITYINQDFFESGIDELWLAEKAVWQDGTVEIQGDQTWGAFLMHYVERKPFYGATTRFMPRDGATFNLALQHGTWDTDDFREVGFAFFGAAPQAVITIGKHTLQEKPLIGTLQLVSNNWFQVSYFIDRNGTFLLTIWQEDDPTNNGYFTFTLDEADRQMDWRFVAMVNEKSVSIDAVEFFIFSTLRDPATIALGAPPYQVADAGIIPSPTSTRAATATVKPTATSLPSPTPAPDYQSLSVDEKIARSQAFVAMASSYDGEVSWTPRIDDKYPRWNEFPLYWHIPSQDWATSIELNPAGVPDEELDKKGETLFPLTAAGYEKDDGSLVLIHPVTGEEIEFEAPFFVAGQGEVTMKDLMTMDRQELMDKTIDTALTSFESRPWDEQYKRADATRKFGNVFIPGFSLGEVSIYPHVISGSHDSYKNLNNPKIDLVDDELGAMVFHQPGALFAVPIYSPESGDFMFFMFIHTGTLASTIQFIYDYNGTVWWDKASTGKQSRFGKEGDEFAILIENVNSGLSHLEGGFDAHVQDDEPGIGDVVDIERIFASETDQEITDILSEFRIVMSIPVRIFMPVNPIYPNW